MTIVLPQFQRFVRTTVGITDFSSYSHMLLDSPSDLRMLFASPRSGLSRYCQIMQEATIGMIDGI